jgi:signal transduction histidine kinase
VLTTNQQAATRALTLLLDNARKFTKPAEAYHQNSSDGQRKLATLRVEAEEKVVRFVVEDTGIGIPTSESEHIFEEFVQLNEYYDGTGIGLTVARSLARRLGGDIVLDASASNVTRFVMTLPR